MAIYYIASDEVRHNLSNKIEIFCFRVSTSSYGKPIKYE
jgi:hypothetical protein